MNASIDAYNIGKILMFLESNRSRNFGKKYNLK